MSALREHLRYINPVEVFLVVWFGMAVYALACGSTTALQCRLDAVSRLPLSVVEDPDSLTVGDVRELARELKQCRVPAGDAGP